MESKNLKIEHYFLSKTLGVGAFGKVKRKNCFWILVN